MLLKPYDVKKSRPKIVSLVYLKFSRTSTASTHFMQTLFSLLRTYNGKPQYQLSYDPYICVSCYPCWQRVNTPCTCMLRLAPHSYKLVFFLCKCIHVFCPCLGISILLNTHTVFVTHWQLNYNEPAALFPLHQLKSINGAVCSTQSQS